MLNQINTIPIQQFIQQVRSADLGQQKEIKLDIKSAKMLAFCLAEVNARLVQDYDTLIKKLENNSGSSNISVSMDGGGFNSN